VHRCTGCCATSPTGAKGIIAAYVIISIRSMIIIQHIVFSPDTLYVRSFWHGYCDEIRLWAVFEKSEDKRTNDNAQAGLSGSMAFIALMSGK